MLTPPRAAACALLPAPPQKALPMAGIHIVDIESAINWWRDRSPSIDGITACAEVLALAEVYALLVYYREPLADELTLPAAARAAWLAWYAQTTAQGDALCKGCGRTEDEVQHWLLFSPAEKRVVWRRITQEGTAWRFNRYAERARGTADAQAGGSAAGAGRPQRVAAAPGAGPR